MHFLQDTLYTTKYAVHENFLSFSSFFFFFGCLASQGIQNAFTKGSWTNLPLASMESCKEGMWDSNSPATSLSKLCEKDGRRTSGLSPIPVRTESGKPSSHFHVAHGYTPRQTEPLGLCFETPQCKYQKDNYDGAPPILKGLRGLLVRVEMATMMQGGYQLYAGLTWVCLWLWRLTVLCLLRVYRELLQMELAGLRDPFWFKTQSSMNMQNINVAQKLYNERVQIGFCHFDQSQLSRKWCSVSNIFKAPDLKLHYMQKIRIPT